MRNIIYIILVVCNLTGDSQVPMDTSTPKATQLEMFLFKIGFTALVNDFENEKNITNLNSNDIKELKANVKYILSQMNKNKLLENNSLVVDTKNSDNSELLKEIEILRNDLALLKSNINKKNIPQVIKKQIITIDKGTQLTSKRDGVNIRIAPLPNSRVIKQLSLGQSVEIEFCNKFGWCKVKNINGYVAKFLIKGF